MDVSTGSAGSGNNWPWEGIGYLKLRENIIFVVLGFDDDMMEIKLKLRN